MSIQNDMNHFSVNPVAIDIQRSVFSRDHSVKLSANVGELIPFYLDEVLPGDTFSVDTNKVIRMQPLVCPVMDTAYLDTYYFFVPNRLVWDHWINFMGENTSSPWVSSVEYTVPQIEIPSGGFNVGTLADYFGIAPKKGAGETISALPFRAYAKIVNDWFYDQNLQNPVAIHTDDTTRTGVNTNDQVTDIEKGGAPFKVNKYHDYFTSCLPEPQKHDSISLMFDALAPVYPISKVVPLAPTDGSDVSPLHFADLDNSQSLGQQAKFIDGNYSLGSINRALGIKSTGEATVGTTQISNPVTEAIGPNNLWADVAGSVFNINQLRQAFAVQRYYERQARSGSRYIETIKAFFNVDSPDARLQRAEYLGGSRLPLNVNQVEQTSATQTGLTPQGNVAGMSVTGEASSDFTKSFTEHGYIIGVAAIRYHHTYQDGVERHWFRKSIFDYYNPVFANLGEQAVLNREIYFDDASAGTNENVFGYQEAWADYRYKPSRVCGEMRSVATTPLDSWHFADHYSQLPTLSAGWIREDKSNIDRALAVTSSVSNQIIGDFYIQIRAVRPMPTYSIPGLIDHH